MEDFLIALIGPVFKLIENAMSDDYDPEKERQEMLNLQRAIYDERLRKRLQQPR